MLCESQFTEAKPGKKASSFAQATEDNLQKLFAWLANRSLSEGWWRRGELNPCPKIVSALCLHV
jgi:hypothetical protein